MQNVTLPAAQQQYESELALRRCVPMHIHVCAELLGECVACLEVVGFCAEASEVATGENVLQSCDCTSVSLSASNLCLPQRAAARRPRSGPTLTERNVDGVQNRA